MIQAYTSGTIVSTYLAYLTLLTLLISSLLSLNEFLNRKVKFKFSKVDILIGLFVIALLRSFFNETMNLSNVLFYLITLLLLSLIIRFDVQKNKFWASFIGSFILIIIVNVFFFIIGIDENFWNEIGASQLSRSPQKLRLLSYFNVDYDRTGFLIFNNFAYYSMLLGLIIISVYHKIIKLNRVNLIVTLTLALLSIIVTDARGPALILALVLIFGSLINRINKNNFFLVFLLIIVVPIIYSGLMLYIGFSYSDLSTIVSSRDLIWNTFFLYYNPSLFEFIFGYGFLGQNISDISYQYEFLFRDRGSSSLVISLHNNYLQYLMDIGLVGIFFLYRLVRNTLIKLNKIKYINLKFPLIFSLMVGISEMGIIINNFLVFYFFIALIYFVDFEYNKLKF
tara:strand:- start:1628 stop:2812 length:1185 start_codon:yes stop_codon:yes gene_type:complete